MTEAPVLVGITSCLFFPAIPSRHALAVVVLLSLLAGLVMIVLFAWLSDQKALRAARDQLRAHLLAVRLFQDQPRVVLRAYASIFAATARYLRVSLRPLAIIILPMFILLVQGDRYLGSLPFQINQPILLQAQLEHPAPLDEVALRLPPGLSQSAPAVHIPANNEVDWRLLASSPGDYTVTLLAGGREVAKQVVVSGDLARLSPCRLRGHFWQRFLHCAEPALPAGSPLRLVAVNYPARRLDLGPWQANWLVVFFAVSLAAALLFKFILGIEI